LEFEAGLSEAEVKKQADAICDRLLANPNIESYRFTVEKKG
jgi:phosphoribosylformylglycinamidine (FGAM) synthase PurS component